MKGSSTPIVLVLVLSCVLGVCVGKIEPECLAYRSLSAPAKQPNLVNCPQYRSLSCCDSSIDSLIVPDEKGEQLYGFNWNRCGNLSDACYKFFQAESCYFECDPYMAPWKNKVYDVAVGVIGVPVCSSYCNAWYEACKDDYTCGAEWLTDFVKVDVNGTTVRYDCPANGVCKKFSEVYTSPKGLCDILWGAAFHYSEDPEDCVVWDFALTMGNPNANVSKKGYAVDYCDSSFILPEAKDEAGQDQEQEQEQDDTKTAPQCLINRGLAEPEKVNNLENCKSYESMSCCNAESDKLVNPKKFSQCGELSPKCAEFFRQYECYYQCDPYMHIFGAKDFGNPETPFGIPLCGSLCDEWFDACKDDLTCATEWTIELDLQDPQNYKCFEGTKCLPFKDVFENSVGMCDLIFGSYFHYSYNEDNCVVFDFKNGKNPNEMVKHVAYGQGACPTPSFFTTFEKTAITLGVVLSVIIVILSVFLAILILKERKQEPVFGGPAVNMQKL